ncbi:ribonuclease T2-like [Entophlyctis sp. JEL0112]|nr:ribonuclease T2-like [Entophlyctis sp. JEL0112]
MYSDTAGRIRDLDIYRNMTTMWVSFKGGKDSDYNDFWSHEWGKHGTCYSPSDKKCVGNENGADLQKFFTDTLFLNSKYDIYAALESADIFPSATKSYKSEDIRSALKSAFGELSIGLICKGPYISEIRLGLLGTAAGVAKNGDIYIPSSCPRYGVLYAAGAEDSRGLDLVLQEVESGFVADIQ